MTKADFLNALDHRLGALSEIDIARSLDYYEEMIDDRMDDGMTEEEAVAAIGDPEAVSRDILREYTNASDPETHETIICPRCSKMITDGSRFCPKCGYSFEPEPNSVSEDLPEPEEKVPIEELSHSAREAGYDLRWYRFLIMVFIWIQALSNFSELLIILSYMTDDSLFQPINKGSWPWAIAIAAGIVVHIGYLIFTRWALAHWKTYAPRLYLFSLFVPFLCNVIAVIVSSIFYRYFGAPGYVPLSGNEVGHLFSAIILFIPNLIYFRNRAELFTE